MKKIKLLLFTFLISILCISNTFAYETKQVDWNKDKIEGDFFTPRIVKDKNGNILTQVSFEYGTVTSCQNDDGTLNSEYCNESHISDYIYKDGDSLPFVRYKNVGTYKGKVVDLKINVTKIYFNESFKGDNGNFTNPVALIHFSGVSNGEIGFAAFGANSVDFTVQYFDSQTGEKITGIKSLITFADIDGAPMSNMNEVDGYIHYYPLNGYNDENSIAGYPPEKLVLENSKIDTVYLNKYSKRHLDINDDIENKSKSSFTGNLIYSGSCGEKITDSGLAYNHDGDVNCLSLYPDDSTKIRGWFEYMNRDDNIDPGDNKTYFLNTISFNNAAKNLSRAGMLTVVFNTSPFTVNWNQYYVSLVSTGFLEIVNPAPTKFVDKEEAKIGDEVNYEIEQQIPNQAEEWYYSTLSIEDVIPSQLDVDASNIKVISEAGSDITDNFDISVSDNKLVVTAKSDLLSDPKFYNSSFKIQVKSTVNNTAKKDDVLNNKAVLKYKTIKENSEEYSIESNEVITKIVTDTVDVPSTSSTISLILIGAGTFLVILGIFLYFYLIKVNKENNIN